MIDWIKTFFIFIILINLFNSILSIVILTSVEYNRYLIPIIIAFIYSFGTVLFYAFNSNKLKDTSGTLDERRERGYKIILSTGLILFISNLMTPFLIVSFIQIWNSNENLTDIAWDYFKRLGTLYTIIFAISLFLYSQFERQMQDLYN